MAQTLKIRKIGGSLSVLLPKDLLAELGVGEGDVLYPVRTPEGVRFTPYDPEFADVMEDARDYMRRHRNAMKTLAEN